MRRRVFHELSVGVSRPKEGYSNKHLHGARRTDDRSRSRPTQWATNANGSQGHVHVSTHTHSHKGRREKEGGATSQIDNKQYALIYHELRLCGEAEACVCVWICTGDIAKVELLC